MLESNHKPNIGDLIRYEDIHNPKIPTYWLRIGILSPSSGSNRERPTASIGLLGRAAIDPVDESTYFTIRYHGRTLAFAYAREKAQYKVLYKPVVIDNLGFAPIEKYYRYISRNSVLTDEMIANVNANYDMNSVTGVVYNTVFRKQYHYYVSIDIKDNLFFGYKIAESDGYATVVRVPMINGHLTGVKEQAYCGRLFKPRYMTYLTFYVNNVMFYDDVDDLVRNIMPDVATKSA